MIERCGRLASAALAWALVAAAVPEGSAPLSSFDFSDAVYRDHGIDPGRIEDRLESRAGASVADRAPAADRRPLRALEFRGGYDSTGCPIYFVARGALRREGFLTAEARASADRHRVFLFPSRGSGTGFRQDALFDATSGLHPLGLWKATFVRFTDKPSAAGAAREALDEIRARNGPDADGTPLLKHVSEVASLEKAGYLRLTPQLEDGSAGAPWMIWPILADPRRERLPADAYLEVPLRAGGAAIDPEIEQNFVCLQSTGDSLQRSMPRLPAFIQTLPIPPELPAANAVEIRVRSFAHRFHPDLPASTLWGYGGSFPGPTIRVRRGEPVTVRTTNDLPDAANGGFGHPWTSCRLETGSIGNSRFPGEVCKPGRSRDHSLVIPEDGASIGWYHDAPAGFSAQNTYKGLAGFIVATDPFDSGDEKDADPRAWRLPSGPCDLPLLLADKEFDATLAHALAWDPFERDAFLGSTDTVNGAVQPILRAARRKYRFRLIDAGPSRTYDLRWSNGQPFILLAGDGGFLDAPAETRTLRLAVGQRRDVVVDFSAVPLGTELFLENGARRLMKILVDRDAPDPSRVPPSLRKRPADPVPAEATTRTFVIENSRGAWTVNGLASDLERPHVRVKRGATEVWTVKNASQDRRHPVEILPGVFRILSRNGAAVPPEAGAELLPGDELRMLVRVGDAPGRYVLPCSNAVHEDLGLLIRWDVEP